MTRKRRKDRKPNQTVVKRTKKKTVTKAGVVDTTAFAGVVVAAMGVWQVLFDLVGWQPDGAVGGASVVVGGIALYVSNRMYKQL